MTTPLWVYRGGWIVVKTLSYLIFWSSLSIIA